MRQGTGNREENRAAHGRRVPCFLLPCLVSRHPYFLFPISYRSTAASNNVAPRPTTESTVSSTVHVAKVSFISRLKKD